MKQTHIMLRCGEDFKEKFKTHCGLVNMSVKIRNLIEIDIAKEQKLNQAEEQAESDARALDKMLTEGEDRALTPPDDYYDD